MQQTSRDHAYDIYFNANYNVEEIAQQVGVTSRTLYKWIKKGNWKQIKENAVRMPACIVENMYSQLVAINYNISQRPPMERFPTKEESEIQRRLIISIKHIKQQATTGETTQVMTNFISWLLPLNHDMAVEMTNYVTTYINSQSQGSVHPQQVEYFNRYMKEEFNKEEEYFDEDVEDVPPTPSAPLTEQTLNETAPTVNEIEPNCPELNETAPVANEDKTPENLVPQYTLLNKRPIRGQEMFYFARPPMRPEFYSPNLNYMRRPRTHVTWKLKRNEYENP